MCRSGALPARYVAVRAQSRIQFFGNKISNVAQLEVFFVAFRSRWDSRETQVKSQSKKTGIFYSHRANFELNQRYWLIEGVGKNILILRGWGIVSGRQKTICRESSTIREYSASYVADCKRCTNLQMKTSRLGTSFRWWQDTLAVLDSLSEPLKGENTATLLIMWRW